MNKIKNHDKQKRNRNVNHYKLSLITIVNSFSLEKYHIITV